MNPKIIAVDFDGTLIEEGKWPGLGATNEKVLNYCKDEQAKGARIILWTNRVGEPLETAIKWCKEHGLRLDAVNDNLPEVVEFFGSNTRKIYADEFIDDRMVRGFELPYYGEPKIKELTPEELFKLYQERYLDGRDPVINYRPHDTIPNAILVEHHSGFERAFYVFERPTRSYGGEVMAGLDGTISIQSAEYRPCLVDEEKAVFHRWIEKDQIILQTDFILRNGDTTLIRQKFEKDHIVPLGMTAVKARTVLGIVEFEDGSIQEVAPTCIKFLDGGIIFHENDIFYKTEEMHKKGGTQNG